MRTDSATSGLRFVIPVVGRLVGQGGVLYMTSLDVSNFTTSATRLVFSLNGNDVRTGEHVTFSGAISNDPSQSLLEGLSTAHFDHFVTDLVDAGYLSQDLESDGFLGSLILYFPSLSSLTQAGATTRFYSDYAGGTISVAMRGHVMNGSESQSVVGAFSDTRGISGTAQLYPNLFLTNIGFYSPTLDAFDSDTIEVRLSAYSSATGQLVGLQPTITIPRFETVAVPNVRDYLNVPASEPAIIVFATVANGASDILGVGAEVDAATKDPAGFYLNSASGAPPAGAIAADR